MYKHSEEFLEQQFNKIIDMINDNKSDISTIVDLTKKYFGYNNFLIKIRYDDIIFKQFLIKCNIDCQLFFIIRTNIINTCTGKYKEKYCLEYKLILILNLLNDFTNWNSLSKSIFYESAKDTKAHYKTIYRQYRYWCLIGIFKKSFNSIIPYGNESNIDSLNSDDSDDNYFYNIDVQKDFFIDSTYIFNKTGSEDIIVNPELTKKNVTKLSAISDVDGFIYSISLAKSKNKEIIFNKKKKKIKTANSDISLIQQTLNDCNPNIKLFNDIKNINLIGDKGYKTDKNFIIQKSNVTIITPNKKNQKRNLIKRNEKRKLGYRFIIENCINGFKNNSRISLRKDRLSNTYMGWVFISSLLFNIKINKKKEKIHKDNFS